MNAVSLRSEDGVARDKGAGERYRDETDLLVEGEESISTAASNFQLTGARFLCPLFVGFLFFGSQSLT